jgi:phage virion morphogenesis protein
VKVSVELGGDYRRLLQAFNQFSDFRRKFKTTALRKMAQTHKQQIRQRILTKKSGPDGEAWAPWAASTRKKRERKGNAGQGLLLDDRKLVNSFQVAFQVGKGKLGSPVAYASALHFGDSSRNLPGRPYAGVGRGDMAELQKTLNSWVSQNLPL